MKPEHDIFDEQLRSALSGLEGSVSMSDWDAVASKLDAVQNRRVIPFWFWLTGMLVLLGGAALFWTNDFNSVESTEVAVDGSEIVVEQPAHTSEPTDKTIDLTGVQSDDNSSEGASVNQTLPHSIIGHTQVQSAAEELKNQLKGNYQVTIPEIPAWTHQLKLGDDLLPLTTTAIFDASVIDAHDLKYIPTINNGRRLRPNYILGKGTWELGLSASPALASKVVNSNGNFGGLINRDYMGIVERDENAGFSYQVGLNASRYITKNVYFSTGLIYDRIGEAISYNYKLDSAPVLDAREERIVDYVELRPDLREHVQYDGHNSYNYFQIPLRLGIVVPVLNDRLTLKAEGGMQYMWLASASGTKTDVTYLSLERISASKGYSRHNFGLNANIGAYWQLMERVEFGFTPYFQSNLSSIRRKNSPITEKPYSSGFNLRLNYQLTPNRK